MRLVLGGILHIQNTQLSDDTLFYPGLLVYCFRVKEKEEVVFRRLGWYCPAISITCFMILETSKSPHVIPYVIY